MLSQFYHFPVFCRLRTFARRTGVLSILKKLRYSSQREYETAFHSALEKAVRPGDVIWDIGANVGLYTRLFLTWSAPNGSVIAFEPFPPTFEILKGEITSGETGGRVKLEQVALSARRGKAKFEVGRDKNGQLVSTTAHLAEDSSSGGHYIEVEVDTVDGIRKEKSFPVPNIVKIDVEGFEEDVLRGGAATFGHPACRHVLVEVHFGRIDERGMGSAAGRIVRMLRDWGYAIQWVDASHLHGKKCSR